MKIASSKNPLETYLITGGAGFIGSNIASALSEAKNNIVICDRLRDGSKWKNLQGITISDIIMPDELTEWLDTNGGSIKAIIHMGAISATTERDVDKIIKNNFKLSIELWHKAAVLKVPFIYASSAATYGDGSNGFNDRQDSSYLSKLKPLNPYGWSKLLFDQYCINQIENGGPCPPQWVGLKFFNVYGPNEHHKRDMRSVINKVFPLVYSSEPVSLFKSHKSEFSDGGQLRDFIYVADCVNVVKWFLENINVSGLFNVGTGNPRSFLDLVHAIAKSLNKEPKVNFIDMPPEIRNQYQYFTRANIQKLRDHGYTSSFYTLEDGVNDYINRDLLKKHKHK